jgi:hypothetical protein
MSNLKTAIRARTAEGFRTVAANKFAGTGDNGK